MAQAAELRALVFDWGDTVMRNFQYSGPMATWPQVEAVPSISLALASLQPHYRLILATNAADSGAELVREALDRVGLGKHFEAVLTARELGVRKPTPAFFQAALEALDLPPQQAAMVGDSYGDDVLGAKEAGMRAVWFNPRATLCPLVHPLHDAEIQDMAQLPQVLESLPPDVVECMQLLAKQKEPRGVIQHAEAVAAVAYLLAARLARRGVDLDPLLVHRGALLHDLDKVSAKQSKRVHGELGAEILRQQGYPVLAEIIRRHPIFVLDDPQRRPRTWEEKVVHYADKLLEDDRIVSVEERIAGLARRHPKRAAALYGYQSALQDLEGEICTHLAIPAGELVEQLREWWRQR